jgi:hypothetical protein
MKDTTMSTATSTHHRFPGSTLGAVLACAAIFGGAAALGMALPQGDSTQPVDPASQCTITSCQSGQHPVLPGRHDFGLRPGAGFDSTTSGGQTQLGQP